MWGWVVSLDLPTLSSVCGEKLENVYCTQEAEYLLKTLASTNGKQLVVSD